MSTLKTNLYSVIDLDALIKTAAEAMAPDSDYTPEEIAGIALELAQIEVEVLHHLEGLKKILRTLAAQDLDSNPIVSEDPAPDPAWKGYPRGPQTPSEPEGKAGVVAYKAEGDTGESIGTVTVTFPKKEIKLRKDTDISKLKQALGSRFPAYFTETTIYEPAADFEQLTLKVLHPTDESLPSVSQAAEARLALTAVEVNPKPTPRVSFKYTGTTDPPTDETPK